MNFDGASKGNLGAAGFGGIFRDAVGNSLKIYYGSIGRDSNNSAELEGLWQGLLIAEENNFSPPEVEGDSQILIDATTRLQLGNPASRVSTSWRLLTRLEQIEQWLKAFHAISFKHIHRIANKVADRLANKGVEQNPILFKGSLTSTNDATLIHDCTHLVHKDITISDVGEQ